MRFHLPFLALAPLVFCAEPPITHEVVFEITHGQAVLGQITLGLFGTIVPKSVDNFVQIARGGFKDAQYQGTRFHRVIKDFMIQGGDFENRDGTGGYSVYGKKFADENFDLSFDRPGLVAYANLGPDSNGSQFFITTKVTDWLSGRHVIFGRVTAGDEVVRAVEHVPTTLRDFPVEDVIISAVEVRELDVPDSGHVSPGHEDDAEPGHVASSHRGWLVLVLVVFAAGVAHVMWRRHVQTREMSEDIEFHRV